MSDGFYDGETGGGSHWIPKRGAQSLCTGVACESVALRRVLEYFQTAIALTDGRKKREIAVAARRDERNKKTKGQKMGDKEKLKKAADELQSAFMKFCVVAVVESAPPSQAIASVALAVDRLFHHFMDSVAKTADAIKERVGE